LMIIPRHAGDGFEIGEPLFDTGRSMVVVVQTLIRHGALRVAVNGVASEQRAVLGAPGECAAPIRRGPDGAVVGRAGEEQILEPVLWIFGDETAAEAGRPAIFVVEPGEHLAALRLVGAGADEREKFVAEIWR